MCEDVYQMNNLDVTGLKDRIVALTLQINHARLLTQSSIQIENCQGCNRRNDISYNEPYCFLCELNEVLSEEPIDIQVQKFPVRISSENSS